MTVRQDGIVQPDGYHTSEKSFKPSNIVHNQ
jgi:hypothetical protein